MIQQRKAHSKVQRNRETKTINSLKSTNSTFSDPQQTEKDYQEKYIQYLLKIPPDWKQAKIHGKYSLLGIDVTEQHLTEQSPRKFFQITQSNRSKEPYSLCENLSKIKLIGSGVAMLFQLKKWIILFELIILIPAVFSMIVNDTRRHASDYEDSAYFVIELSLGNFGKPQSISAQDQSLMYAQSYFHIAALIAILILGFLFSKYQKQLELDVDDHNNTPSDYALHVYGIPRDTEQEQVAEVFNDQWRKYDLQVYKVN